MWCVSSVVLLGQAEIKQVVECELLCPYNLLTFHQKSPFSIKTDEVKSFRVHPGRIEHDVIRCAITERVLDEGSTRTMNTPLCNILFVHELKVLGSRVVRSP